MSLIERFQAYALAFEETYVDDDWSRIEPFFHDDASYESKGLGALDFRFEGRDNLFAGLRGVLDRLDRRFATRTVALTAPPTVTDDAVIIDWVGTYAMEGAPDLVFHGRETLGYREGRIATMLDEYPPETRKSVEAWFAAHGHHLA